MELSSLEQAVWYEGTARVVVLQQHLVNILPIAAAGDEMMAVADSILDFAVATCQKEYSTIFLYNFPIQDADDTPNHRIFEPRADKQTPMSMHDVDAPSPPKNDEWT